MARFNPTEWTALQLRASLFRTAASTTVVAEGWWEAVTGTVPEIRLERKQLHGFEEAGPFEGARLILKTEPSRIDWLLVGTDTPSPKPDEVGPLIPARDAFVRAVQRFLDRKDIPDSNRLALGIVASRPVDSKEQGYRVLADYLPAVSIDPVNSSDFLYQINRVRTSQVVPGVAMNRLQRWSVSHGQLVMMTPASVSVVEEADYAVRIDFDFNTTNESSAAVQGARDRWPALFEELSQLAYEVLLDGDQVG